MEIPTNTIATCFHCTAHRHASLVRASSMFLDCSRVIGVFHCSLGRVRTCARVLYRRAQTATDQFIARGRHGRASTQRTLLARSHARWREKYNFSKRASVRYALEEAHSALQGPGLCILSCSVVLHTNAADCSINMHKLTLIYMVHHRRLWLGVSGAHGFRRELLFACCA